MPAINNNRVVKGEVTVNASVDQVWRAWTTNEGAETFFAPRCAIDARPGGKYKILFDLDQPPGTQGTEGMTVMAVQPGKMLSFTWNNPPEFPGIRNQRTHVTVSLEAIGPAQTKVVLRHDGWGEGGEWDAAFEYFEAAWKRIVLPRLKYRFEHGPIDWNHPPDLNGFRPE
jgi:uncharacterized protein YndB with AHSA1/START domain